MYCDHKNTSMYGTSEECLDCGARKHKNSYVWHRGNPTHSGNQEHPRKSAVIIDRDTGEVIKW